MSWIKGILLHYTTYAHIIFIARVSKKRYIEMLHFFKIKPYTSIRF
jgi:hypothetical protein